MNGLYDYILWLGEFDFSAVPLREADAVILCLLTYCDFTPLFEHSDEALLRDCQGMIDAGAVHIQRIGKTEPLMQILEAAAKSRRFGELRMTGCVDIMLPKEPIQFSAVTYHSDAGWSFIAYRGTDSSLAGWKEDFMISFKRTEAQSLALQYAEDRINTERTWYLGGHSKGGNLALYATCMLPEDRRASIGRMFLLDGPGFCPEVIDPAIIGKINPMVTRIIPGFSIIGKLFDPRIEDTRIVQSSASGFLQHDPATWGIDHGKLALLPHTAPHSDIINTILGKWIGSMACEDREVFVNDIFDALNAGGAETIEALESQGLKAYETISARFRNSSEITKRTIKSLSQQAMQAIRDALFHKSEE